MSRFYPVRAFAIAAAVAAAGYFGSAVQADPAKTNSCETDPKSGALIIKDSAGQIRASLNDNERANGSVLYGNGIIYDAKDSSKGIVNGVNFTADFTKGTCKAEVLGDWWGSATVGGAMKANTTYSHKMAFTPK